MPMNCLKFTVTIIINIHPFRHISRESKPDSTNAYFFKYCLLEIQKVDTNHIRQGHILVRGITKISVNHYLNI